VRLQGNSKKIGGQPGPRIPGTVLLCSRRKNPAFAATKQRPASANLQEPSPRLSIIDGQHRLAALRFYLKEAPGGEAATINVPLRHFDGRPAGKYFAAEMVSSSSIPPQPDINKSPPCEPFTRRVLGRTRNRRFAGAPGRGPLIARTNSPLPVKPASTGSAGGAAAGTSGSSHAELFQRGSTAG